MIYILIIFNIIMIKNEMITTIFKNYKEEVEKLYKDESACLLIFRILPKQSQDIIMRIINIDENLNATHINFLSKINWQDFLDDKEKDKYKGALITIKILTNDIHNKEFIVLEPNFKTNLKKIIKDGISVKSEFILKSKQKNWNQCYEKGMVALEKYLTAIKSLDTLQEHVSYDNEKYKFLINSGFIRKDIEESGRLTPFGLAFLLDDIQTQLRTLMVKFVLTIIHETKNKDKKLDFFYNLFKLCSLEIGVVIKFSLKLEIFHSLLKYHYC